MTVGEMTEAAPGEGDDEEKLCMQKRHCQSTTPSMSLSELRYNVMTVTVADTPSAFLQWNGRKQPFPFGKRGYHHVVKDINKGKVTQGFLNRIA